MRRTHPFLHLFITITLLASAIFVLPSSSPVQAQDETPACPTDLFFSEYLEGGSNNKALEIYNGTGETIDFTTQQYVVKLYSNAATTATNTYNLSTGSLAPGDVYVIAHLSAVEAIKSVADVTINGGVVNFNGDDAVALYRIDPVQGEVLIDVIGQIGVQQVWGTGDTTTQNHTLVRKSSIMGGDTNANDAFDPSLEWDGYAQDTFTYLGSHTIDACGSGTPTPDLTITKTGPARAVAGELLTYVLTVRNSGITDATNAVVFDTYPPDTEFESQDSPFEPLNDGRGQIEWHLGTLAEGTSATITVTLRTEAGIPAGTVLTNIAEVRSDSTIDDTSNNSAQAVTEIIALTPIRGIQFVDDPATSDASPKVGETVTVEGIVTAEPGEVYGATMFVIEDPAGGPWSGLPVYFSGGFGSLGITEGAKVRVTGRVTEYYGLTEIQPSSAADVTVLSTGNPLPPIEVLSTGDFPMQDKALSEQWEGVLIEFRDAQVVDEDLGHNEWSFDDGSGEAKADDMGAFDSDLTYKPAQGDQFSFLRGIGWYDFNNYKLEPRRDDDIGLKPDLIVLEKAAPVFVLPGDYITYTLSATNPFNAPLTGVVLQDALPEGTSFVSATGGGTFADGIVTWNIGDLGPGATVEVQLVVTAPGEPAQLWNSDYSATADQLESPTTGVPVLTVVDTDLGIHHVQGAGDVSPLAGRTVEGLDGIVIGLFYKDAASTSVSGFFMQDPNPDADPLTSEGIFVYTGSDPGVYIFNKVTVSGLVSEYQGQTQISDITALTVDPYTTYWTEPVQVTLPVGPGQSLEPYEGMWIEVPHPMTVAQNYFLGRYGQLTLSAGGRLYNPTNGNGLGEDPDLNLRRMLILDDGTSGQNPNPIPYIGADDTVRAGDLVSGLIGVLDQGPINASTPYMLHYRLHPTNVLVFDRLNERTDAPEPVGGRIQVASFNVLNYFTTLNSRGANSDAELQRQEDKIVPALAALDAEVVGLLEIENNGITAVSRLVEALNEFIGDDVYTYVVDLNPLPSQGADEIKTALIYKPGLVTPVGDPLSYQVESYKGYSPLYDRPPLVQTFEENATGERFTVVVNHFKSKGSCPGDGGADDDQGDGQGCWNAKRIAQAEMMLELVESLKAEDPDVLVIGDLNSYGVEDPILTLTEGGLVDAVAAHVPAEERYTYIFDGYSGYLDHALATGEASAQITDVTLWHINADEPSVIDYNTEFKPQDLYEATPFRSSDHDPVLVGLNLGQPDLQAVKEVTTQATVKPGDTVEYRLTLANSGEVPALDVTLTDALPAGLTFTGWEENAGAVEQDGTITWSGDIPAGAALELVFTARVGDLYGETVTNTMTYTSLNAGSGAYSASFEVVKAPGLAIEKTVTAQAPVKPGDEVEYTLILTNNGEVAAVGVTLTDTLPAGLTFTGWEENDGAAEQDGTITWSGDIPAGAALELVYTARVGDLYGETVTNTATFTSQNAGSGADSASFEVAGAPELEIEKTVATPAVVEPGDLITYTITVTNTGASTAVGVRITDTLPAGVDGDDVDLVVDIESGKAYIVEIFATVAAEAPDGSLVTNTAYFSHSTGSGSASASFTVRPLYRTYFPLVGTPND